jgi:tetratricopeptide (TPR) repeat protein
VLSKVPNHKWTLSQALAFSEKLELVKAQGHFHTVLAEGNPDDADLVIDAADYLSDQGDPESFEKAVQLMANLTNAFPDDTDLSSERNRIEAKKVVNKLENAEDQTDALKDKDAAKKLEEESQQIKTADDLEKAIARAQERETAEPESARAKEVLADLLFRKGDLLEAIEKYKESIEIDPNNQSVQARLGDTQFKVIQDQIKNMEDRLPNLEGTELEDLKARLTEKKKDLRDTRLNEYSRRLKVNPNDLKTRFELGGLFFQAKAFDKAIQQFQRSVQDARLAFRSSQYLGHCFKNKKLFDMAITEFTNASKRPGANASDRLNVLYEMAICHELAENKAEALAAFKAILEKDFGFKDVASRVEALQK